MIRTTPAIQRNPDAILTADWHLRENTPPCRTDEFLKTQWEKVKFVKDLQRKYDCPVYHAGDLFDYWKPSPELLTDTFLALPKNFHTIYGNHDLPQHSLSLEKKSGVFNLYMTDGLTLIRSGVHWGQVPNDRSEIIIKGRRILLWHVMTFQGVKPFPGCTDVKAAGLLRKFPNYDLIVTGHNHQSFVEEHSGRILLNPGCLTRQESDQLNHVPKVWLYFAETNSVEPVVIPHRKEVVVIPATTQKLDERNDRINAFVEKLNNDFGIALNFDKNLEAFMSTNPTPDSIKQIIYKALDNI